MTDTTGAHFVNTIHHDTYRAIDPAQWDMRGMIVLITGSSRGIGRAIAVAYARAGVSGIAITAREAAHLDEVEVEVLEAARSAKGPDRLPKVLKLALETTSDVSVLLAAERVRAEFGRLDVLVNNAARLEAPWRRIADPAEGAEAEWWATWEVNVRGTYLITRALLPLLLESRGGGEKGGGATVVNLTTMGALTTAGFVGATAYQMSKLAVIRFGEFLELEYGAQGILAFAVHPGIVPTDMGLSMPASVHSLLLDTPALGGDTVVWLTKERREWLQGRYVNATWDVTELEAKKEEIVRGDKLKVKLDI